MGNCFSVQLSGGDALIQRCWDCIALRCNILPQLRSNLQKLCNERDYLRASKDEVKQRLADQQGPHMRQLESVRVWVSQVEDKLSEVDGLIRQREIEKNNLCFGGYCSKTCCSSYHLATMVVESLADVFALKERGNFDAVVERVAAQPEYISRLEKDLAALQAATEELKALKNDVMRRVDVEEGPQMMQLEQVKLWISRVDLLIPECDSLTRDGPQEIQKLRNGDMSSSDFGERVAKALADVMAEIQKGAFEAVVGRVPIEPVVERPSEPVVGQESTLEEVWNCLMGDDSGIIGIYGMGGVGKTTLLTEISNRFCESSESIKFLIWVVASKDLRPQNLQEEIADRIGLSGEQWKEKQFSERAAMLHGVLRKKKFILFIDDLWTRVDLKDIGIPLPNRRNMSKVVFTTRSKEVCGKMGTQRSISVDPLPWEKAWQLFEEKVGREALDADFDIPDLAKEVAKECAGLPLALATIGQAMACKNTPHEWKHALQVLKTLPSAFPEMGYDILPKLKFSYDNLPNEKVRSCLLYCSLFPEDHLIPKDELIHKWVCERFSNDGNSQIDPIIEGYSIIATLIQACLLEDKGRCVKMHDLIREMCLWIASEDEKDKNSHFVRAGSQMSRVPNMGKWTKVKRISLMQNNIKQLTEIPETPSLLTLFLGFNRELEMIGNGFFQYMKALRVLDLSNTRLKVLPTEVGELVSLHYLDISATMIEKLPWELTMLKKLKCFYLESLTRLEAVPRQMISSFPTLQILRMGRGVINIDRQVVEELESLQELKELSIKIFMDLSALCHFLESYTLSSCLQYLEIWYVGIPRYSMNMETEKLGDLHKSMGKICFGNLKKVELRFCECYFQDLTWLILAPNLTELKVVSVEGLEEIISYRKLGEVADRYERANVFSRLRVLSLDNLGDLKSICLKPLLFPSLDKIQIYWCPKLKKIPLNPTSAECRHLMIEGEKEWWDGLEWEDDASRTRFATCFREISVINVTYMIAQLSTI